MHVDLAEALTLTLSQQFEYHKHQEAVSKLSRAELEELVLASSKLIMLKDNLIKQLMQSAI